MVYTQSAFKYFSKTRMVIVKHVLPLLILTMAAPAFADTNLVCAKASNQKELAFSLNLESNTVTFQDVAAFEGAHIAKDQALALDADRAADNVVAFEYDWYYTAQYELQFDRALNGLKAGDQVGAVLNGSDDDGAFFNDISFNCKVQ